MTQAGPAIPVVTSTDPPDGGPALRVAVVSDGRPTEGGPARRVVVVSDGRPTQGNEPLPVVVATGAQASMLLAGPPIPVVVVSGTLNPAPVNTMLYFLRDKFTDAQNPLVDGAAEPGPGARDVSGTRWFASAGKLFGGSGVGEAAWGTGRLVYGGAARANGRTLWAIIRPEDRQSPLVFSWATIASSTAPLTDGHGWAMQDGSLDLVTPSTTVHLDNAIHDMRPMLYMVFVVLLDTGAAVLISTVSADTVSAPGRTTPWSVPAYPLAAIAHITRRGTITPLYPSIQAKDSPAAGESSQGHTFDDVRAIDVAAWAGNDPLATFADRFARADGVIGNGWLSDRGTWTISSNQALCSAKLAGINAAFQDVVGTADGVFQWTVTTGTTFSLMCCLRRTAAGNYIRLVNNGTGWSLQVIAAHTFSSTIAQSGVNSAGNAPFAASTTYQIVCYARGNMYLWTVDDVPLSSSWITDAGSNYISGTGIGIGDVSGFAATLYDNIALLPLEVTLPTELQAARNLSLFQVTAADLLGSDAFTDTTGTALTSHTPTSGPAWATPLTGANATIQSNKLSLGGTGFQLAIQNIGTATHECQVDIAVPASITRWVFAGICVAYIDSNNWFIARLAADTVAQPNEDEIEVLKMIGGVATVVGKVQFGKYYTDNSHNPVTLSTRVVSDAGGSHVLLIFLDGHYVESYYLPTVLAASTRVGLFRHATDDEGSTFDNWSAEAIGTTLTLIDTLGNLITDTGGATLVPLN